MRNQTTLSQSLISRPINTPTKWDIAGGLLNVNIAQLRDAERAFESELDSYFLYYSKQVEKFLHDGGHHISVQTHQDTIDLAKILLQGNLNRETTRAQLQHESPTEESQLEASINFTARLIFMMRIGTVPYGVPGGPILTWNDASGSIKDFVASHFTSLRVTSNGHVKLDKFFTAQNLDRIAGLRITWTDDIADHLRLFNLDTEVAIFHHASFLAMAKKAEIFPEGFVEESLKTLSLLLPPTDEDSKKWFRKLVAAEQLDISAHRCRPLQAKDRQIDQFTFWRDRLVTLKQVFDESEPQTWKQWWFDKRKGLYRWPFLVTAAALALTALFGLIQSIEGALQVYKAYHPSEGQ